MRHRLHLAGTMRPDPASFIFCTGDKEVVMEESKKSHKVDYGCESRCVEEFVECIETEDGASICKTRERNCYDECSL
jgi:hypothetical protein